MRVLATLFLLAVAVGLAFVGFGALSNLWADYQDNSTEAYLVFRIPPLLLALVALWGAANLWRKRRG